MAKKKVKRWKSRPASKRSAPGKYALPQEERGTAAPERESRTKSKKTAKQNKTDARKREQYSAGKTERNRAEKHLSAAASTAAPVSDERQRVEQMREQRRRKKKQNALMFRIAVVCAVLVIGITVSLFVFFKIGEIKVTGTEKYTAAQVINASGIELGDNLFSPSSMVVQKRVGEALPYIKSVSFKHELPDTLTICIKETSAVYAFKASSKYILTDEELKLLEISDKVPAGAAVVEGVGLKGAEIGQKAQFKNAEKGKLVSLISSEMKQSKIDKISAINVKNTVDLSAVYDGKITILFGQGNELEYKCRLAAATIQNVLEENENAKGTINVKQANETKQAYFNPES